MMNNDKYIIKSCGQMPQIIATLKTLQAIFGKGATLSQIAAPIRYIILNQALKEQFENN